MRHHTRLLGLAAVLGALTLGCWLTSCASAPQTAPQQAPEQAAEIPVSDSYVVGASDVLRIQVWKEPDFSVDSVVVAADGKLSLPLVGEVQAAGLTIAKLRTALTEVYKEYTAAPTVSVMLLQANSCKFYVVGNVTRPGEFPLNKDTTLIQAISAAGGLGQWADRGNITIIRRSAGGEQRIKADYDKIVSGKDLSQNVLLRSGDTIIVP